VIGASKRGAEAAGRRILEFWQVDRVVLLRAFDAACGFVDVRTMVSGELRAW